MTEVWIELDNDDVEKIQMAYSDVLKKLSNAEKSGSFAEFYDQFGHKVAVLPAHVVAVYQA